ncbi:MAG: redox-regulated ATPase YchF [Bacteroidota bacterium]|nr:redox-regulated ATPase YchF [Bacteroidota bacterium]
MKIGIIGLPSSGKSTLFQTISKAYIKESDIKKNAGNQTIVKVPDERLTSLIDFFKPKKENYAVIEFAEISDLQNGESGSVKFTTSFLDKVKTTDTLLQVVRLFDDPAVPHPEGSLDVLRDISMMESEFILTDMALIESRIDRMKKNFQKSGAAFNPKELSLLERCLTALENSTPLRNLEYDKEETKILRGYQLLSQKPVLVVLNLSETDVNTHQEILTKVRSIYSSKQINVDIFFGKIEMEIAELPSEEAKSFMLEYGISESTLSRLIRNSYELLGLQSFFTVGDDECRAWTIKKGMTAQEAASVIHSDFFDKFIRAEVVHYNHFIEHGSFAKCKERGVWRLEGKEYIVKDGDIISVRHS